jgi:hypothetical protein
MHWKFHETVQVCCDNFPWNSVGAPGSSMLRDSDVDELASDDMMICGDQIIKGPKTNTGAPKTNLSNYHSSSENGSIDSWKHGDRMTETIEDQHAPATMAGKPAMK